MFVSGGGARDLAAKQEIATSAFVAPSASIGSASLMLRDPRNDNKFYE